MITDPAPCDYVTGLVDANGFADHANLSGWVLQCTGDADIDLQDSAELLGADGTSCP